MKLIFLGPPGAGKGTHAQILSKKYKLVHLATGDILRKNIRAKTDIGLKAKEIIEKGELVSDDIINNMMFEEMKALGDSKGIILDGFPRTLGQAMALDEFLVGENETLRAVVNIDTSEEVIVKRLSGRRISPGTGRVYHIHNLPPKKDGICDDTGEKLSIRKDDEPETLLSKPDFLDWIENRARYYGNRIGVKYGEPFFSPGVMKANDLVKLKTGPFTT